MEVGCVLSFSLTTYAPAMATSASPSCWLAVPCRPVRRIRLRSFPSPMVWIPLSLVLWIALHRTKLKRLFAYMDDSWGLERPHRMTSYKGHYISLSQAMFLALLDQLNVPWYWGKQLHGASLEIIGFQVDSATLRLSM